MAFFNVKTNWELFKLRKFLYLTYYYPPISEIASMRSWKLAQYIGDFGWEPIVVTSKCGDTLWHCPLPDVSVYRISNKLFLGGVTENIKKSFSCKRSEGNNRSSSKTGELFSYKIARLIKRVLLESFAYPDGCSDWRKKALVCGREVIARERPEAILSSSGPSSSHLVADQLSREFGIPWIADYRDLWNGNPSYKRTLLRRFFEERLEKKTLNSASKVVSVSQPLADDLGRFLGRSTEVITNGFDQNDYNSPLVKKTEAGLLFSIVYTGIVYRGKRDPEPLFSAIKLLLDRKMVEPSKIRVVFWGTDPQTISAEAMSDELRNMVVFNNKVSVEKSIEAQREASVLLFLSWTDLSQKGFFTGKIFEYLGARRPILAIPENPGSVVDKLIEETNSGVVCSDPEAIAGVLKKWYDEFYEKGKISYRGVEEEIMRYERKNQARQFADLLNSICEETGSAKNN